MARKGPRNQGDQERPPLPKPPKSTPDVQQMQRGRLGKHREASRGERMGPGNPPKPLPSLPRKVPQDQGPRK